MKRFISALFLFFVLIGLTVFNLYYTHTSITQLVKQATPILDMEEQNVTKALSDLAAQWEEKRGMLSLFLHEASVEQVNAAFAESLSLAETEKPDEAKASLRQVIIFLTELREREYPNLGNVF